MIGYVTVGTNDLPRAAKFYDAIAAEMDAPRMMEFEFFQCFRGKIGQRTIKITAPADNTNLFTRRRRRPTLEAPRQTGTRASVTRN